MADNNTDNSQKNKFDRFLKCFPIFCLIITLSFMLLIALCSNDIKTAIPNYKNVKTFTEIYEIPLKLFLILLTIWGILVAYSTYIQTKDQFIVLNRAWIDSNIKFNFIPTNPGSKYPALFYEIENTGNTPAKNLKVKIDINPNNIIDVTELNKVPEILFPKSARTFSVRIGNNERDYVEIEKAKPSFIIEIKISYVTFDNYEINIKEKYRFDYPNLPYIIESNVSTIF